MRILYLAQRVPYPPDRGDKIITYHQVRHLAQHHEVAVACLADGAEDLAHVAALSPLVSSVDAVLLARPRARCRAMAAVATRLPLTVAYFNERELHARIRARIATRKFDVIIVCSSGMAQFVEACTDVPRIMHFVDLDSRKWQQFAARSRPLMRWVYRLEAGRLLHYERRIATAFERSLVCTYHELEDFQRLIPQARVSCVANGVDLDYFTPMGLEKTAHSLIFTGMMDYFPNVDGIVWFCHEILPLIRAQVPDVTLTICGARPAPRVEALRRLPGVTVTGRVADVRPYMARARLCVAPLRLGRGIQNKLLEAMAMGLPAVATTVAFTGVEATPGTAIFVADTPGAFAASAVRLLRDDDLRARAGLTARAAMQQTYRWDVQLARLDEVLASVTAGGRDL